MRNFIKKTGLVGLFVSGVALGILLSVHLSAVAEQEHKPSIPYEDLQLLATVFGKIKSSYVDQVPDDKLIREAINGMVHGLDPHSDFLDSHELEDLKVSTQGKFGGLGIEVNSENDVVKVVSPIEDTPAFRAGIKSGDLIIKIDETVTRGLPLSKAVDMMRGKPGTSVTLTIARKDETMPLVFKLVREEINVKSIRYKMVEPGYGYVRIRTFQERSGEDLMLAVKSLYKEAPLKGLVLDLRSNPGGLLSQAVSVSAAFLPKDAMVVYTEGRIADARMELKARPRDYLSIAGKGLLAKDYLADLPAAVKTVPMVVLIDGGSASASEIVAGALQDHQRALLMGASSFGKGSVQTIMQIDATHALKLTTARYFTPSGRSIQAKGIDPDVAVDDGRDVLRIREANLEHHMETPKNGKAAPHNDGKENSRKEKDENDDKALPPARFEFGSAEDFQLQQALNQLKGLPVIAAIKKAEKKNDGETVEGAAEKAASSSETGGETAPKNQGAPGALKAPPAEKQ
ncbi:MAG: S41 family peptidase [Burkholderiales bacterium]|jgi:carboxyl-terminal processing protease|nr:S41 family peptidase [Burkholderiales bacterium]